MTECERIAKEGFLSENFFKPETICDFYVDKNRKKLWAIELDLLRKFDAVCKAHNLLYILSSGTLLGAVRHKGFIPWDDDIDVAMPREDYMKLLTLADEFESPYLLQYPSDNNDYAYSFAKIRNINTTFASESFMYNNYNQGCFLDIFPYDEFNVDDSASLFDFIKPLAIALSVSMKRSNPKYVCEDIVSMEILSNNTPFEVFQKLETIAQDAKNSGGGYMTSLVSTMTPFHKKAFKKDWIYDTDLVPFENLMLPIPKKSHDMLSLLFGDYMQYPTIEKRGTHHAGTICDTDTCFDVFKKAYINKV